MIKKYLPRHLPKLGCKGKLGSANVFFHVTNGDAPSNVNACCISSCTLSTFAANLTRLEDSLPLSQPEPVRREGSTWIFHLTHP